MTNKIIVAKEGFNALTETDPDNLIFSSDYNTLKYFAQGDVTVTVDYADYYRTEAGWYYHRKVQSVAHNLDYSPFFIVFTESLTDKFSMVPFQFADVGFWTFAQAYTNNANLDLVVEIRNQSSSGTIAKKFSYKIFKNSTGF